MLFGPIHVTTLNLKNMLLEEIHVWIEAYTSRLHRKTLRDVEHLIVVFQTLERKLERPIRDLSDTRISMETLRDIRSKEVEFDQLIELVGPLVPSFLLLNKLKKRAFGGCRWKWR